MQAAKAAFHGGWKQTTGSTRSALLLKLGQLIERDADEIAAIEAADCGLIFPIARHLDVKQAFEGAKYFAGWADKLSGKSMDIELGIAITQREPLGVTAGIVPWNTPFMIAMFKLAPAIAAGNVILVKPAELAPLSALKLGELIKEAGFPPGVVNIVCGYGHTAGQAIAEHMDIRKISFTGSGVTGRHILKAAASSNMKKVSLELGGKGPSIVFDDADLNKALFWTHMGITAHNGQICAAGSRIFVQDSIYDQFVAKFQAMATEAVHGDPLMEATTKGPLISSAQHSKVLDYIKTGQSEGAKLLFGGKKIESKGHYIQNTAFVDVKDDMRIQKEEIFGPVAVSLNSVLRI